MFWKTWKPENLKTWKLENFENIKNDPWDMLNNFCFHVYAQKSLFEVENVNAFFYVLHTVSCEFANHRAGSQLKKSIITLYVIGNGSELFNDRPLSHAQVSLSTCIEIQPNLLPFIISCIAIH